MFHISFSKNCKEILKELEDVIGGIHSEREKLNALYVKLNPINLDTSHMHKDK